jgi:hypothetical protein
MSSDLRSASRVATCAIALLLIAGCGGATAVVSSPSSPTTAASTPVPTPTRRPSASPVPSQPPSQAPSATPAASGSLIDTLKIGSPYTLVYNPANPALSADFSFKMGSITVTEAMRGREIHQRGKPIGFAFSLEITGIPMNDAAFEGGARGAATNTNGKLTYGKVLGHKVAYVVAKTASFALYLQDGTMVMVAADTLSLTKTLLTSVIKAND